MQSNSTEIRRWDVDDQQNPTYNLKAVVKETGIKPDTLRAWERRYGMPQPSRTAGKHRLYSQQDIDVLKWLVARQEEGLSISRAVNLYRTLEGEGQDPLQLPQYAIGSQAATPTLIEGRTTQELRKEWLESCLEFDEQRANVILSQAFAIFPPEMVVIEVIGKGLSEIGAGWYEGEISVQQEHFTSELALRQLETLVAGAPPPTLFGKILVACPPGEQHTVAPLLLHYLIKRSGRDSIFLGANVPNTYMEETVEETNPNLVVMIAQGLITAATMLRTTRLLESKGISRAYGGGIFIRNPSLRDHIPGHYLGDDLTAALETVDRILRTGQEGKSVDPLKPDYQAAYDDFQVAEPKIKADAHAKLTAIGLAGSETAYTLEQISNLIAASLSLGDIHLMDREIDWIRQYMVNLNLPIEALARFIKIYSEAIQDELGDRGKLIIEYLDGVHEASFSES
jgi:DNA-binding transcriptional MerR regulator